MSYKKLLTFVVGCTLLTGCLSGCSFGGASGDTASGSSSVSIAYLDADDMFTDRDKEAGYDTADCTAVTLADQNSSCADSSVSIEADTVTITAEGTYLISGSLTNGQLVVDADDAKVQLVFDSVTINNDTGAAVYIKKADKVFVTLADGSANTLSNKEDFVAIDDNNIDAVIFSKSDLTLNGSGSLTVNAAYGHGIVSKDDLVITGGTYQITAAQHALSGKDSVRIADGDLTLSSGTDGIHSENSDKDDKGFIYIADGNIDITSSSDGFDAQYTLQIDGGTISVSAGDDGVHADGDLIIRNGKIDVTKSYEGLEGKTITIEDGEMNIVASDDGLNAAGDGTDDGTSARSADNFDPSQMTQPDGTDGTFEAPTEMPSTEMPDGAGGDMQAPTMPDGAGGDMQTPPTMPDGDSGDMQMPTKPDDTDGGMQTPTTPDSAVGAQTTSADTGSSDDSSGNDSRQKGGGFGGGGMFGGGNGGGGGMMDGTDYNLIQISGGTLYVDADGDGIDSNGSLSITGGEIYVCGPTNGGNGALDYGTTAAISGGTVVAVGSSGMAQNFSSDSTQGAFLVTVDSSLVTGDLTLTDADGNTLVTFSPTKSYNSVVISTPSLTEGATYTLTTGDITTEVEMTSLVTGSDGMGGGFGGVGR